MFTPACDEMLPFWTKKLEFSQRQIWLKTSLCTQKKKENTINLRIDTKPEGCLVFYSKVNNIYKFVPAACNINEDVPIKQWLPFVISNVYDALVRRTFKLRDQIKNKLVIWMTTWPLNLTTWGDKGHKSTSLNMINLSHCLILPINMFLKYSFS